VGGKRVEGQQPTEKQRTDKQQTEKQADWQADWQPLVEAVGRDFGDGSTVWGADLVERGTIRRFAEPLELSSGLHYDPEIARAHGFPDVIAPYTAAMSFSVPAMWSPGETTLYRWVRAPPGSSPPTYQWSSSARPWSASGSAVAASGWSRACPSRPRWAAARS
jgi:hypothetical protein